MSFELPTFAQMKGHAVSVMNHMVQTQEFASYSSRPVFQFPIELRTIHGYKVFLVNETSGIIWKQGVPKEMLREEDALNPHSEHAWAFVLVNIERNPHKIALQRQLFPQFSPYVCVVEVHTDWQEAVRHTVLHAASCAWTQNILSKSKF